MAVLLEDILQSVELWLKLIKKESQPYVDSNLDPVLLVPGIAGSILKAMDTDNCKRDERVWVRILRADYKFRTKLWSRFDPSTGKTVSLDPKTSILVPEDRYGLYAIDVLDPDLVIGRDCVYYFHDMIVEMIKWGFQEGKTLFGFGYDFRQSNRLPETMECFATKLESVYIASGGKKINIISHSMGGLLVKCFMSLHSDIFEKYVKNWIAIAAPFRELGSSNSDKDTDITGWRREGKAGKREGIEQTGIRAVRSMDNIYGKLLFPNTRVGELEERIRVMLENVDGKFNSIEERFNVLKGKLDQFSADNNALREDLRSFMITFVKEKEKVLTVDKLDRVSIDNNTLGEDLRSFVSKFVREKDNEVSTEGIGVRGAESSESITLGTDEDMIDQQGKFKQKIKKETKEFLEDDCEIFSQIQEAIYIDFGIKDVHEQNFESRNSEFLEHCVVKEVQNFRHGLQHVLTNQNEVLVAGVREMEWDAIELPFSVQKICLSHENFTGNCNFLVQWG
ncbi:hypothetical protein GH714_031307 [Hevea brasiliensis]|uniref:Uncharacterized protein n=1 Tax=Hevea brasiliensis TaxID=3981 RepID=A0A6A6KFI0_HEVBR|nr:hypothetical protein GH714_031307 [Hevea brasiliensis]